MGTWRSVSSGTTCLSFSLEVEEEPPSSRVNWGTKIRGYTITKKFLVQIAREGRELMGVESSLPNKTNFFGWACTEFSEDCEVIGGVNCGEA